MSITASDLQQTAQGWHSDFWGTLNTLPPDAVTGLGRFLEVLRTLPAFQEARRWLFDQFRLPVGGTVLEAGSGAGAALPDMLGILGRETRVTGIDPTTGFVTMAREYAAQLGAAEARYEVGDIRAIPCADGAFDAAFCEKILIHVSPVQRAVDEMARITRPGGRVGAIEWWPFFVLSTTHPELASAFNGLFRGVENYLVVANLAHHFHSAGLRDVEVQPFLAYTQSLDAHPGWRALTVNLLVEQAQAGQIEEATAKKLIAELEALNARGEFSASFIVYAAVGTKSA